MYMLTRCVDRERRIEWELTPVCVGEEGVEGTGADGVVVVGCSGNDGQPEEVM
jgi:hypothetical protein